MLPHDDLVVVPGRSAVLHAGLGDRQKRVGLRFHVAVIEPVIAAKFDPPDLEPDQIIRVINDAGLIGLGVTDAQPWSSASFIKARRLRESFSNALLVIVKWRALFNPKVGLCQN